MAIEDRNLTVGTRLVANYRKQAHACTVEKRDEGGGFLFVLEDGRKFKSASSAASASHGRQGGQRLALLVRPRRRVEGTGQGRREA